MLSNFPKLLHDNKGVERYGTLCLLMALITLTGCVAQTQQTHNHDIISEVNAMTLSCFVNYAKTQDIQDSFFELDAEVKAWVEERWQQPLPSEMIPIGGIDGRGWARFCRDDRSDPTLFTGEYADQRLWVRGTFRYHPPEGHPVPDDIFNAYYMSHYTTQGLVLYSRPDHKKRILLVPVDIIHLPLPEQDQE